MTAHPLRRRFIPLLITMTALLWSRDAAATTGGLALELEGNTIRVEGLTRGGELVLLGAGVGRDGAAAMIVSDVQRLQDDDGDGTVMHTSRYVRGHSVWIAVDVQSGASVTATPHGNRPAAMAVPPGVWTSGRAAIDVERSYLSALYVRPGAGAWRTAVTDGGPTDSDGIMNGVIRLRLDALQRLAGDADRPASLRARDVVVLVDPHTLETIVAEVR